MKMIFKPHIKLYEYILFFFVFLSFFLPAAIFFFILSSMIEICAFLIILIGTVFSKRIKNFIIKKRNDYRIYVIDLFGL